MSRCSYIYLTISFIFFISCIDFIVCVLLKLNNLFENKMESSELGDESIGTMFAWLKSVDKGFTTIRFEKFFIL